MLPVDLLEEVALSLRKNHPPIFYVDYYLKLG